MSVFIREGSFDVAIASAPGVEIWPSAGVRALTSLCADMGLEAGLFGGDDLRVRGVIPLGTGGILLVEDPQRRIHRIRARAVVKVSSPIDFPDPFPGWRTSGFIPLSTAARLKRENLIHWDPCTVVLGTGNRALRFATALLQGGAPEAYCIELPSSRTAKGYSGWEVERRRFEMSGGKILRAQPVSLIQKGPMLWEFRVQDEQGVRIIETCRVISAGPFRASSGVREYPPGSLLFELQQTAANTLEEDVQGWKHEEELGRWLGVKIVRSLCVDLGPQRRDELDRVYKRARGRLKRYSRHASEPFLPSYNGKWMVSADIRRISSFSGVPQREHRNRPVASVECLEEIACDLCQKVCPTQAIQISPRPENGPLLREDRCTACGLCLAVCPSQTISMLHEPEERSLTRLTLSWHGAKPWKEGEFALLLNRRGDVLGSARISSILKLDGLKLEGRTSPQLVQLDVPSHLAWEARALKRQKNEAAQDEAFFASIEKSSASETKVEITLNGEKRLARDHVPLTGALFEMGCSRAQDALFCQDGSCGLCEILVDGNKVLACQTLIRKGMSLKLDPDPSDEERGDPELCDLCPCVGVSRGEILDRMRQGHLKSPEAVLSVVPVGSGKCHGELCMEPFRRALSDHGIMGIQGIETDQWIDWRFPWTDWSLGNN